MRALLLAVGVLGLAVVFGWSEAAPASAQPVTSDDVQLVSEQMSSQEASQGFGRNGTKRWGNFRNRFVLG